ncbi:MAG: zf-HC2 domain-containing protein [Atribacterota bacterium]
MQCRDVRQKISAFIDEELAPWEYHEVARHLDTCLRCQVEYRKLLLVKVIAREIGRGVPGKFPEVEFSLECVARTFRLRKALWIVAIFVSLLVAIFLMLGWQRSLLDEQILSPNHFVVLGDDVLSKTQVKVETLELVTGEYR